MERASEMHDLPSLKDLLLDAASQHTVEGVLECMVRGVCRDRPNVVTACVWLLDAKDDGSRELRLAKSACKEEFPGRKDWVRVAEMFAVVALDEPLIGHVARDGKAGLATDPADWPGGHPTWARQAGILSYFAEPIVYQGDLLGVLGVFTSISLPPPASDLIDEGRGWIRLFADCAGANVANARAFQEIERLRQKLEMENEYLREEVLETQGFGEIIGQSPALKKCLTQVDLVAPTEASVLIFGESGTGKELLARAIHERSKRKNHPLIKVNCASVPHELFESEFFGHARGSFTGAIAERRGRFQLADRATLFLDEVGDIPLDLQGKLLRVLQDGMFERVGEDFSRRVDVRVLAATNRDLMAEIASRRFREDLYYRLSVFPIHTVPLRERIEDIPLLTTHFLKLAARQLGCDDAMIKLKKRHIDQLQTYPWPGNIRELQNVVQRAVILARAGHLEFDIGPAARPEEESRSSSLVMTYKELREHERANLRRALEQANGKIFGAGGAAELLGVNPTTLASRIKAMSVERPKKVRSRARKDAPH